VCSSDLTMYFQRAIVLHFLILVSFNVAIAQDSSASNAVYLELGGAGGLYSINYDRLINDNLSIRVGYSSWAIKYLGTDTFKGILIKLNYINGQGNSRAEYGLGIEYVQFNVHHFFGDGYYNGVIGVGSICYRYQPKDGGFHFRIGPAVFLVMNKVGVGLEISTGLCF
jgi:hypothetical protein